MTTLHSVCGRVFMSVACDYEALEDISVMGSASLVPDLHDGAADNGLPHRHPSPVISLHLLQPAPCQGMSMYHRSLERMADLKITSWLFPFLPPPSNTMGPLIAVHQH